MVVVSNNNLSFSFVGVNKESINKHIISLLEIERHTSFSSWNKKNFTVELELKDVLSFLLFIDEEVAGFSILSQKTKDCVHLHRFCLAKKWQGRGIGKIMMAESIKRAKTIKASYFSLKVPVDNQQGLNFYNNFNFKDLFIQDAYFFKVLCLM